MGHILLERSSSTNEQRTSRRLPPAESVRARKSTCAAGARENGSGNVTVLLAPAYPENHASLGRNRLKTGLVASHNPGYNVRAAQRGLYAARAVPVPHTTRLSA